MKTCAACGHPYVWAKIDGQWWPYEFTGQFMTALIDVTLTKVQGVQLHQCRREWVREFERRLMQVCPKCERGPGEYCQAMSGAFPRPDLMTLLHEERR